MAEENVEYAEAIQVGKRRSSLGALHGAKKVSKLKSMFESQDTKKPGHGILGRLKPSAGVSASHDPGSVSDVLASDVNPSSQTISLPAPQTPTAPLFAIIPPTDGSAPTPRAEASGSSIPGSHTDDGAEPDTSVTKSPGSGNLFKRMGKTFKKMLTPKSSAGKQKSSAASPGYAASDVSMSPRPMGQLPLTPSSQPSSASLDLGARSDQRQPPRSPTVSANADVPASREDQEWGHNGFSSEGGVDVHSDAKPFSQPHSATRPPLSPKPPLSAGGSILDAVAGRLSSGSYSATPTPGGPAAAAASPASASAAVSPPMASSPVKDQADHNSSQPLPGAAAIPAVTNGESPVLAAGPAVSPAASPLAAAPSSPAMPAPGEDQLVEEDSFDASLTASPVNHGSEEDGEGASLRDVNMGADLAPLLQMAPPAQPADDLVSFAPASSSDEVPANADKAELVFPSLPATAPASPQLSAELGGAYDEMGSPTPLPSRLVTLAIDSATPDVAMAEPSTPAPAALIASAPEQLPAVPTPGFEQHGADSSACAEDTVGMDMEVEAVQHADEQELSVPDQGSGAAPTSDAVVNLPAAAPSSPEVATPTGDAAGLTAPCIAGLSPIKSSGATLSSPAAEPAAAAFTTTDAPDADVDMGPAEAMAAGDNAEQYCLTAEAASTAGSDFASLPVARGAQVEACAMGISCGTPVLAEAFAAAPAAQLQELNDDDGAGAMDVDDAPMQLSVAVEEHAEAAVYSEAPIAAVVAAASCFDEAQAAAVAVVQSTPASPCGALSEAEAAAAADPAEPFAASGSVDGNLAAAATADGIEGPTPTVVALAAADVALAFAALPEAEVPTAPPSMATVLVAEDGAAPLAEEQLASSTAAGDEEPFVSAGVPEGVAAAPATAAAADPTTSAAEAAAVTCGVPPIDVAASTSLGEGTGDVNGACSTAEEGGEKGSCVLEPPPEVSLATWELVPAVEPAAEAAADSATTAASAPAAAACVDIDMEDVEACEFVSLSEGSEPQVGLDAAGESQGVEPVEEEPLCPPGEIAVHQAEAVTGLPDAEGEGSQRFVDAADTPTELSGAAEGQLMAETPYAAAEEAAAATPEPCAEQAEQQQMEERLPAADNDAQAAGDAVGTAASSAEAACAEVASGSMDAGMQKPASSAPAPELAEPAPTKAARGQPAAEPSSSIAQEEQDVSAYVAAAADNESVSAGQQEVECSVAQEQPPAAADVEMMEVDAAAAAAGEQGQGEEVCDGQQARAPESVPEPAAQDEEQVEAAPPAEPCDTAAAAETTVAAAAVEPSSAVSEPALEASYGCSAVGPEEKPAEQLQQAEPFPTPACEENGGAGSSSAGPEAAAVEPAPASPPQPEPELVSPPQEQQVRTDGISPTSASELQSLGQAAEEQAGTEEAPSSPAPGDSFAGDAFAMEPMMISPIPAQLEMQLPAASTPASAAPSTGTPTAVSPETARLGVRAFPVADFEDVEMAQEADGAAELAAASATADPVAQPSPLVARSLAELLPLSEQQSAVPQTAECPPEQQQAPEQVVAAAEFAPEADPAVPAAEQWLARLSLGVSDSIPVAAEPIAAPVAATVVEHDSLEAMEALMGDDLLNGGDEALLMPEAASSPVAGLQHPGFDESKDGEPVTTKKTPSARIQCERESLQLFSERASMQTQPLLTDESVDFDLDRSMTMAKSRAVPFIPMASVTEGVEPDAASDAGSPAGAAPKPTPGPTAASPMDRSLKALAAPAGKIPGSAARPGPAGILKTPGVPAHKAAASSATPAATASIAGKAIRTARPSPAVPSTAPRTKAPATTATPSHHSAIGAGSKTPGAPHVGAATPQLAPHTAARNGGAPASAAKGQVATPTFTPHLAGAARSTRGTPATPTLVPASVAARGVAAAAPAAPAVAAAGGPAGAPQFDTPAILRAAAVPLGESPFPGTDFDMTDFDMAAEANRAIAMLGGEGGAGASAISPVPFTLHKGGKTVPGTPTQQVLEAHVQLLTNKLAGAEAEIQQLQEQNNNLRDQLRTLEWDTSEVEMERDARQFVESELKAAQHRTEGLEAELRAARAPPPPPTQQHEEAFKQLQAAQQVKEAEWSRRQAEMDVRMQQMEVQLQQAQTIAAEASGLVAAADARAAAAEQRAAASKAERDEEAARCKELQSTLGLQAHQMMQVQRARDENEAKFQKAMEQLVATQTNCKKQLAEYDHKVQAQTTCIAQFKERHAQVKQQAAVAEQRAVAAETAYNESVSQLAREKAEKDELMRMCNQLLLELEAVKGAQAQRAR